MSFDFHPITALFPRMSAEELAAFSADIKARGVREAITLWTDPDGKTWIIDGRHRWEESQRHGVECPTRLFVGTVAEANAEAKSLNEHRRHLNASQRAALAAEQIPLYEAETRLASRDASSVHKRKSAAQAAQATGASGPTTERAKEVMDKAHPAIHQAIKNGFVLVNDARKLLKMEPDKDKQAAALAAMREGKASSLIKAAKFLRAEQIARDTPEASDDNPVLDELGNKVPKELAHLFVHGYLELRSVRMAGQEFKKFVSDLLDDPVAAQYLGDGDIKHAVGEIDKIIYALYSRRPYAICPAIRATHEGCRMCSGKGWLNQPAHELATKTLPSRGIKPQE